MRHPDLSSRTSERISGSPRADARRRRALTISVALICSVHAWALPAQVPAYAASVGAELDTTTARLVSAIIDDARLRGLPTEPLMAKVREGRLKRAPAARIRAAVAALTTRLDSARAALGMGATAEEMSAGADALGAGASTKALRALRNANGRQPMIAVLGALAQLVASGVPETRAVTMLMELIHRSTTPAQLLAFGNAVEYDVSTGLPPDEAALFRLRRMEGMSLNGTELSKPGDAGATSPAQGSGLVRPPQPQPPQPQPRRRP